VNKAATMPDRALKSGSVLPTQFFALRAFIHIAAMQEVRFFG
jgi:hypothetical protein